MLNRVIRMTEWKLEMPAWGGLLSQLPHFYWMEVLALALGVPLLKLMFALPDPFFLQTAFPWLLLPLLLIALRYGTLTAMSGFGMVLMAFMWYGWQTQGGVPDSRELQQLAGMSIILLVVGELAGGLQRRYREGEAHLHTLRSDMSEVERELQVLQVSHAQLEEELLGVGHSLKRSLDVVKNSLPANLPDTSQQAWLADKMMDVLSAYRWLEVAAFLAVEGDSSIRMQPLAQKGRLGALQVNDRLLLEALRTKKPVGFKRDVHLSNANKVLGSSLMAVLPVLDKNARVQMLLAVQHVEFAAYTQKNLNLLATLCNWLGNLLPIKAVGAVNTDLPAVAGLPVLVDQIYTTLNLLMENKRSLVLLGVSIPQSAKVQQYTDYFAGLAHGSNSLWQVQGVGRTILILALPLSNPERFTRYQQSVEGDFYQRFQQTLSEAGISLVVNHIHQSPKKQQLIDYLRSVK
jgi:hypothetical protein